MSEGLGTAGQGNSPQTAQTTPKPALAGAATSTQNTSPSTDLTPTFKGTKHKVKIDGKEQEVDYDELVADYQTRKASIQRLNDAQQRIKAAEEKAARAEQIEKALESGDIKFLESKMGRAKAKEAMENYLIEQLEYEQLSPAEKRALELEEENKQLKQKEEAEKKRAEALKLDEARKKAHEHLDAEIKEALTGLGRKPTPRMALRIVDEMIIAREGKRGEISAKDASQRAIKRIHGDIGEYLTQDMPVDELLKIIPQHVIDRLREHEVQKVTGELSRKRQPSPQSTRTKGEPKPKSIDDWFDYKAKKLKGR